MKSRTIVISSLSALAFVLIALHERSLARRADSATAECVALRQDLEEQRAQVQEFEARLGSVQKALEEAQASIAVSAAQMARLQRELSQVKTQPSATAALDNSPGRSAGEV